MSAFTFPQPGERQNTTSIPVPEEYLGTLLIVGARDYQTHPCPVGGCSHCGAYVYQWWACWHLLSEKQQERIDVALDVEQLGYPEKRS